MEALASSPNLNLVTAQRYPSKYPHTRSDVSRVQIWPGARRVLPLDFWWNLWKEAVSLPWGCYPGRTDTWAARSHLSHLAEKPVWEQSRKRRRMIMSKIQPQSLLFQLYSKLIIPLNKLISHFWLKPKWETEKAMAPHSSTLAWKIPWMEEPGRLQSMGSLRVGHDWVTSLSLFTFTFHFHFSLSCIGEGNGNPLQCSCLENPRDGEAWWAAVYGVTQSQTWLQWLSNSNSKMRELPVTSVMWRLCCHLALLCGENPEASRVEPWKLPASRLELRITRITCFEIFSISELPGMWENNCLSQTILSQDFCNPQNHLNSTLWFYRWKKKFQREEVAFSDILSTLLWLQMTEI